MAEMTPVANQVQAPSINQGLTTFADILGIRGQQQSLQQQQIQMQAQAAQASQEQQKNGELQKLQALAQTAFNDSKNYSIDQFTADANKIGPYAGAAAGPMASAINSALTAKRAVTNLSADQNRLASGYIQGAIADPSDENVKNAARLVRSVAPDNKDLQETADNLLFHMGEVKDTQGRKQFLNTAYAMLSGQSPQAPATMNTGAGTQTGTVNNATGAFSPSGQTIPAYDMITLSNGQTAKLNKTTNRYEITGGQGNAAPPESAPSSIGHDSSGKLLTSENDPSRPSGNATKATIDAWYKNVDDARSHVQATREADSGYGNQMAVADQIRHLSNVTNTGPGTPEWTRLTGMITSRFGGSQGVTNAQTLESFLDRQAASLRGSMGLPNTNAGSEQAQTIGGNIGMQGGALRAKNNYNEALAQGLHDYRTGLDHVEGFSGNPSPSAVNKFKSAWAQNFDPVAYEWKLAMQRGDRQTADAIASNLSPAQRAEMQQKGRALDMLSQGRTPQ